jgi:hypothetical protein
VKRSEWSDKQLEDLLRNMPKIEDHRDPRDIYQNISLKMNKKKQRTWVIPSLATAAAVLLIAILAPSVMNWNESTSPSMDKSTASESAEQVEMAKIEENEVEIMDNEENAEVVVDDNNEQQMEIATFDEEESYTALYEADVENENVFTFAIPDQNAQNMVPITVVVPKGEGKEPIEQLNETMPLLPEEQWGLSEYYPLDGQLSWNETEGFLKVNVSSGHHYGEGSASEYIFRKVIKETAKTLGTDRAVLYTEDKPGIELGNTGNVNEINVDEDGNHAYYFYYTDATPDKPYLVPYSEPFADIESALNAMRDNIDTHGLRASIPEELSFEEINSSGEDVLTLQFSEGSNVTEDPSMIHTIEAILLTAKEFQFDKVKFEYDQLERIGKFTFNEELEVPIAPNKMELIH